MRSGYCEEVEDKRDKVAKIARLSSCKNFVSESEKFIFDAFVDQWRYLRMGVI